MGVGHGRFHNITKKGDPAPGSGLSKIIGWDPGAQAIVEGLQPYNRGNGFTTDPLWILHELDRVNKHRLLHVGTVWTGAVVIDPSKSVNVQTGVGIMEILGGPVTTDTPIAKMAILPLNPNAEMHMDIQAALEIAFAQGPPVAEEKRSTKTLRDIYMHVRGTIVPALVPYL